MANGAGYIYNYSDPNEIGRIDWQHRTLTDLAGGALIPPQIDSSKLRRIADVCTGTGAWLLDLKKQLGPREFHGFDVNADVFAVSESDAKFTVHDIREPFVEEFRGSFDLVHVRFTFTFLEEKDLPSIMQNIAQLLSPGGYLVWTEVDPTWIGVNKPNERHSEILQSTPQYITKCGRVHHLPDRLLEQGEKEGLKFCSETTYRPLHILPLETLQHWEDLVHSAFLPKAYLILDEGLSQEQAQKKADGELSELREFFKNGETWDLVMKTLCMKRTD